MTQLEDCYFCGTVEEPLESYAVIPPDTYPPEEAQRTVVVCPTCRAKLGRVLEPIIGYFGPPGTTGQRDDKTGTQSTRDGDAEGRSETGETGESEGPGQAGEASPEQPGMEERDARTEPDAERGDGTNDAKSDPAELPEGTEDIVRLLRNREFPVKRGDIVTVGANAYGVGHEECEAAIDALIDRGWLIERDGELHRGD